jgi:hypothetical protein
VYANKEYNFLNVFTLRKIVAHSWKMANMDQIIPDEDPMWTEIYDNLKICSHTVLNGSYPNAGEFVFIFNVMYRQKLHLVSISYTILVHCRLKSNLFPLATKQTRKSRQSLAYLSVYLPNVVQIFNLFPTIYIYCF